MKKRSICSIGLAIATAALSGCASAPHQDPQGSPASSAGPQMTVELNAEEDAALVEAGLLPPKKD